MRLIVWTQLASSAASMSSSAAGSPIVPSNASSTYPFTCALQDPDVSLWAQVVAVCTSDQPHPQSTSNSPSDSATYQVALPPILTSVDALFSQSGPLTNAQSSLSHSLTQLSLIESTLDTVITSLEQNLSHLDATSHQLDSLRPHTTHLQRHSEQLSTFIHAVQIPDDLHSAIHTAHPHSSVFASALETLSDKLNFIYLPQNSAAISCHHIRPILLALKAQAIHRVNSRLDQTFHALAQTSSFDILRNSLLYNQRHLIQFISKHADPPTHPLPTNCAVMHRYVRIARSVLRHKVVTYTAVLSTWAATRPTCTQSSLGLANIARNATGMFSAVFKDTLANFSAGQAPNELELQSDGHEQCRRSRREEVELVLRRWTEAMGTMDEAYVTEADLMIRQGGEGPRVEELYRNAALFYADIVQREISFLQNTFGNTARSVVEDVLEDSGDSLLGIIETEVASARSNNDGVVGMTICLMLNRRFRCGIQNVEQRDLRVSFLLIIERMLQTGLLEEFDQQARRIIEGFNTPTDSGCVAPHDNLLLNFATLVADVLIVVSRGAELVDAADMAVLIQRRLRSSMNIVADTINKLGMRFTEFAEGQRVKMRCAGAVLSVLDIPEDLVSVDDILTRLKEPVLDQWNRACAAYGTHVADKHNTEIVRAISAFECGEYDAVREELVQFGETLEAKIRSIKESFAFLTERGNVSRSLRRLAEQSAFAELASWNEKIARLVREHMSSDLHLLVTRSVFARASDSE